MLLEIIIILALILLNGFFSLAEMSLVSSRKARLRHEADQGKKNYRLALAAAEQPAPYLSSIQVAITLIGILTGAVGGATVSRNLGLWLGSFPTLVAIAQPLSVILVVLLTTLVSVVVGELVPKNLALSKPEPIAAAVIRPLKAVSAAFSPLARFLSAATNLVIKLLGFAKNSEPAVTEDEVMVLIAQGAESGVFENSEKEMVEGVLDLDDRRVTAFMTPRTDVVALDLGDEDAVLRKEILANAQYACLPAIEGDLDRVVGMLDMRRALATLASGTSFDIRAQLSAPVLIPESISALRALAILKDKDARTGLIVDEYGGVSGLVTVPDLLFSVLAGLDQGESEETAGLIKREDGSYLVDGALTIGEFAEALDVDENAFDTDAYDTVAGLVLYCMGSIPKAGERCEWAGLRIEIVDMDGNRIDKLLVSRVEAMESPEELEAQT
ncbi:MAG: hemolysin family protein [Spirochaetia bacterium]|jgi:putative hemolysin|nr:hemolysin family protein [Spirochaetales bacterium]MDX9784364.1 hemolysin family protein [Spirochaetia bacterium]